jgi:hypothetical protein
MKKKYRNEKKIKNKLKKKKKKKKELYSLGQNPNIRQVCQLLNYKIW